MQIDNNKSDNLKVIDTYRRAVCPSLLLGGDHS